MAINVVNIFKPLPHASDNHDISPKRPSPAIKTSTSSIATIRKVPRSFIRRSSEPNPPRMVPQHHERRPAATVLTSESPKPSSDNSHHRISIASIPILHLGKSSKEKVKEKIKETPANSNATLTWKVESPPIIFHGDRENSSGALVSGLLFLTIKEEDYPIDSFKATLNIHITQKKPFTVGCKDCTSQHTEVKTWDFLPQPMAMSKREHGFPFSVLLDGHLPASLDGPLVSITYNFKATAIPKTGHGNPLVLERTLDVKRSLYLPDVPHHSVRVFPPTNVKASVEYPQMIHPIGANSVTMRLDGIAKPNPGVKTVEYWKLKKLTWRLEETSKAIAPACAKHAPRDPPDSPNSGGRKGIQRTETHLIGEKAIFNGWKSQFAGQTDSQTEFEFEYQLGKQAKFSCDTRSAEGSEVSHQLTLEMVISQEYAPIGKPHMITQTGVGRILRMSFPTVLTERAGIGISWDNEQPPIYQDVPPSPPTYNKELAQGVVQDITLPAYLDNLEQSAAGPSGSGDSPRSSAESMTRPRRG